MLLFGREPTRYVKGASIQVVRWEGVGPGPGPVSAREELDGPIPLLLERALIFIDAHTTSRQAVVGSHRETLAEYPPAEAERGMRSRKVALAHAGTTPPTEVAAKGSTDPDTTWSMAFTPSRVGWVGA